MKPIFRGLILSLTVGWSVAVSPASGDFLQTISSQARVCATLALDRTISLLMRHYPEGRTVQAHYAGRTIYLRMDRELGMGFFGTVMGIGEDLSRLPYQGERRIPVVAKMPNRSKLGLGWPLADDQIRREYTLYQKLQTVFDHLPTSNLSGLRPELLTHRLPLLPIYLAMDSDAGFLLVKPRLPKESLFSGIVEMMRQNGGRLTDNQRAKLERAFHSFQAVAAASGFGPDLRPQNISYVADATLLKSLDLTEPDFVWVEMAAIPFSVNNLGVRGFESYLSEFEGYARFSARRK